MRIGINAHLLSPEQNYRAAGVSNYTEHLLRGLASVDTHNHYYLSTGSWARDISKRRIFGLGRNFHWSVSQLPTQRSFLRILWEQSVWPLECGRRDLVHSMLNVLPLWQVGRAARVITIHDLAFLLFSDKHSPAQRKYLEISTRAAAQRADRIIAVSENTRQDILRLLNVSPNKVVTVAEAAGSEFTPLPPAEVASFRAQRGLPHRFFFYLGTLEPRKNIPELLRGYALMRQQEPAAPALIIAGPKGWLHDEIFTLLRELQLAPFVSFPGFVPRDELALWFNAALCFIYLSEYEGFGLPPLQAMACGIPPIINNASSLPEIVGDTGILVNAHDAQDVASALRLMACDESKRLELGQKALDRSRMFSWQRAARETLKVYREAHAETR